MKSTTILTLGVAVLAVSAQAQSIITVTSSATGWYRSDGFHDANNNNYVAGALNGSETGIYHDFFVFDLSGVAPGTLNSVTLNIYDPAFGYQSPNPSETLLIGLASTPISTLESSASGSSGIAIYNDLAAGFAYGFRSISSSDNNQTVSIDLDGFILFSHTQALLGSGQIALSGYLSGVTSTSSTRSILGGLGSGYPAQLVLNITPVPEPSTLALAGLGGVGVFFALRRRK